jgi:hypothetical protein
MTRHKLGVTLALVTAALVLAASVTYAQFGRQRERRPEVDLSSIGQVPYDGKFTFARLRFSSGGGQGPGWFHDYPRAERNLMQILKEVTTLDPFTGPEGGTIVGIGDPELFKFPFAYMSEPGQWNQTDEEVLNLRNYLLKGGFIIFDDFRGGDWYNFEGQLQRVLPGARLVELDLAAPVFHSFFEIETLEFHQMYDRDYPVFFGVYEENDPTKRMMIIVNYNNDIGEYWEFSNTGYVPIDLSNEAYKFGVNYFIYGMTH